MPNRNFRMNSGTILFAAIAAAYPVAGFGAPAARVDFTTGNVTAVGPNGKSRALTKGAQVEQGETIATNNGRAQLRFTDGAYVSLQPQSEFRIDQYRFAGKQDGSEKGFFSLIKGGLRTITGLVGRNNKNNYQVTTSVATIGIRGTEYAIQYGQSITGTVGEGEINVCNGAGCLSVMNGESYYVQNGNIKPVLTNKRTDLPPAPPQSPLPEFKEGESVAANGELCSLFPGLCGFTTPLTGTLALDAVVATFGDLVSINRLPVTAAFDSAGKLIQYDSIVPTFVKMGGNDGIVAWGTFLNASSSNSGAHFVAGLPVPTSDLAALGGTVGTYSLINGPTAITNSYNNEIGVLKSASLTIHFGVAGSTSASSSVTGAMAWTLAGLGDNSASLSGSGSGTNLSISGNCGGSCSVSGNVALFGSNASRAGMAYKISDSNLVAIGAAALAKE